MIKEIYVHIGYNKTGTTSIQEMMYQNASLLLKHRICYPTLSCNHSKFLFSMFTSNPEKIRMNTIAGYTSKEKVAELNKNYTKKIEKELANNKIDKVIFSGEHLIALNLKEVEHFSRWLSTFSPKITIICCTRGPIEWYNSRIQQQLKERTKDINSISEKLSTNAKLNYFSLKPYLQVFGSDNLIVYDFDKHKKQIYKKFLQSCHMKPSLISKLLAKSPKTKNESLSHECCLILSSMNRLKPWKRSSGNSFVEPSYLYKIKGEKFRLQKAEMEKILLNNSDGIKWLSTNFKECNSYQDWPQQLSRYKQPTTLFKDETIESITLLISNLSNNKHSKMPSATKVKARLIAQLKNTLRHFPKLERSVRLMKHRLFKT